MLEDGVEIEIDLRCATLRTMRLGVLLLLRGASMGALAVVAGGLAWGLALSPAGALRGLELQLGGGACGLRPGRRPLRRPPPDLNPS